MHHCKDCTLTVQPDAVQTHINISDDPKMNHPRLPGLQRSNLPLVGHQGILKASSQLHMKHLTNEEIPEPPQPAPFVGEWWSSPACLWGFEFPPNAVWSTQHLEETHSCCLHQRCHWFGHKHYPELMAIGERRKADRPVTEPFHFHALASFQLQSIQNKNNSKSINPSSLLPSLINKIQRYLNSSNWSSRSFPVF